MTRRYEAAAFLAAVLAAEPSDACIEWPFDRVKGRYGRIVIGRRKLLAHRRVCETVHGPAPSPAHETAHSCANAGCVNPRHLRWATKLENAADRVAHGNAIGLKGSSNPMARLTDSAVRTIKAEIPHRLQREIAADFGVSQVLISRIKLGKAWAHV